MAKIRAFIAIELPDGLKKALSEVQETLKSRGLGGSAVSWARPGSMHLTLRFLGDVDERAVDLIKIAMQKAAKGINGFDVSVKGIGAFPGVKNPRVIWAGIKDGAENLKTLFAGLENGLAEIGLEKESRPFYPHLTLARIKERVKWVEAGGVEDAEIGRFRVTELVLFKSDIKRGGAVHTPLARTALNG